MSIAELPMPSTTTSLPRSSSSVAVLVGVDLLDLRTCRGRGRPARASARPSGGRWRPRARRSRASRRRERELHTPVRAAARRARTRGLEADAVAEAEVVDVGVEVLGDLGVMRVVGVGPRHREVRVLHALARRVDVQRRVGGGHPVGVAEDPVAADAVGRLEAVERHAALVQRLGGGDAGRAGADHGGPGQLGHLVLGSRSRGRDAVSA